MGLWDLAVPRSPGFRIRHGFEYRAFDMPCGVSARPGGNLEHPFDGQPRPAQGGFGQFDPRLQARHAIMQFFEGIHFHETAFVASAILGRRRDEYFIRTFLAQSVKHSRFGRNDKFVGDVLTAVSYHSFSRTDFVRQQPHCLRAFRMRHNRR